MTKEILKITGMHCASCARIVEKNLSKEQGIKSAEVNFATEKAEIKYDSSIINPDKIRKIVIDSGYNVVDNFSEEKNDTKRQKEKAMKIELIVSSILTFPVFIRMFWMWMIPGEFLGVSMTNWVQHNLSFLVVFIFGWQFHSTAFKQLIKKQASMDTLVSLGTLAAHLYSVWAMFNNQHVYFESSATITSLILLGKFMELKSKNRASRAMEKLLELSAKKAIVLLDGKEIETDVDVIELNNIVVIKPGEKIALDGEIIFGETSIDESMLTGESLPVNKKIGDKIYSGTININGIIHLRVTKKSGETMLSQIIKTVEEAQNFKAPIQKLADKISGIFVPIVIIISLITFVGWMIATKNFEISMINAVAVLIIACPCALGIATPIAIMVGTSVGSNNGILIKSGENFEKAKKVDAVAFDKTGTLTEGKPTVTEIFSNNESWEIENKKSITDPLLQKIIKIGGSLAKNSNHPISKAIFNVSQEKNIELATMENFTEILGKGVSASCQTHKTKLFLGNLVLLKENNLVDENTEKMIKKYQDKPGTISFVVHGGIVLGGFIIKDRIKKSAKEAIQKIKSLNLEPILISGDNRITTKAVAKELGIEKYFSEVLPQDKQKEIKKIQAMGKKIIFVGDGINDAPSLIQADLGIAMGSGTDIAKESGDIIIIKNDPLKVYEAIKLSQKTFAIIKQNLFWAFFYNVLAIPLAVAGMVNPMIGALAMAFSDVTVIGNSLRIYKK